jgi:predicted secreted protein
MMRIPANPISAAAMAGAFALAMLTAAAPASAQTTSPAGTPSEPPAVPGGSQPAAMPEFPQLSLTGSAAREVTQDRVTVTLYASHEAQEPGPAQARVNEILNPVLERLRGRSDLEVQSGGYRTTPVRQESRTVAWQARGSIRLTATPSDEFNKLVGQLATELNVESISHFLSPEAQAAAEETLIAEAVAAFRSKADAATKALGFKSWTVRSVSLGDSGLPMPMPKMMMARGMAAEAEPMPLEEGKTTVSVSLNGTVVLLAR